MYSTLVSPVFQTDLRIYNLWIEQLFSNSIYFITTVLTTTTVEISTNLRLKTEIKIFVLLFVKTHFK